jgi:hypothetical protein
VLVTLHRTICDSQNKKIALISRVAIILDNIFLKNII